MIDVIRLPDELSIEKRIINKMLDVYGTCPYCTNNTLQEREEYEDWYSECNTSIRKKKHVSYKSEYFCEKPLTKKGLFIRKKYDWYKLNFYCYNCGMSWSSPEYPMLGDDKEANKAIFNAWKDGKNMEINTLLIGVINKE